MIPFFVRGVEGIGDLDGNPDRLVDGQRALREPRLHTARVVRRESGAWVARL
jgi:hypothetical protein